MFEDKNITRMISYNFKMVTKVRNIPNSEKSENKELHKAMVAIRSQEVDVHVIQLEVHFEAEVPSRRTLQKESKICKIIK